MTKNKTSVTNRIAWRIITNYLANQYELGYSAMECYKAAEAEFGISWQGVRNKVRVSDIRKALLAKNGITPGGAENKSANAA